MIDAEELEELVPEVWFPVLGTALEPVSHGDGVADELVSGKIAISGAWEGMVQVSGSKALLRDSASKMFATPMEAVNDADMTDALCEIVNIFGGTLKSMLPEPCDLSLPESASGYRSLETVGEAVQVDFLCGSEPLRVEISGKAA